MQGSILHWIFGACPFIRDWCVLPGKQGRRMPGFPSSDPSHISALFLLVDSVFVCRLILRWWWFRFEVTAPRTICLGSEAASQWRLDLRKANRESSECHTYCDEVDKRVQIFIDKSQAEEDLCVHLTGGESFWTFTIYCSTRLHTTFLTQYFSNDTVILCRQTSLLYLYMSLKWNLESLRIILLQQSISRRRPALHILCNFYF